ncbi:MAG: polysaccharide deacetylase family protein [Anaerolineales bacterium]|nr:polysaccharide deacetylase family protein [Anaerolineales bacterium]
MTPLFHNWARLNARVLYEVQTQEPIIALTIDDGPDPRTTPQILDLLARYDAHATFFVLADRLEDNDDLVSRMVAEGHELGNHMLEDRPSIFHPVEEFQSRLNQAHAILSQFGKIRWFRPGSALYSREMLAIVEQADYQTTLGSVYPFDSHIPSPYFASRYILWQARPGSVIVLHDYGARGERTLETLSIILPELIERGYSIRTLSELVAGAGD